MAGGAPLGNKNGAKSKVWSAAITRALERRSRVEAKEMIDELANTLIDMCLAKDLGALKEFGDRMEGKPAQVIAGDGEAPVVIEGRIKLVKP